MQVNKVVYVNSEVQVLGDSEEYHIKWVKGEPVAVAGPAPIKAPRKTRAKKPTTGDVQKEIKKTQKRKSTKIPKMHPQWRDIRDAINAAGGPTKRGVLKPIAEAFGAKYHDVYRVSVLGMDFE